MILLPVIAATLAALPLQQPPTRVLTAPQLEHREAFSRVEDVRELADGRVIVLDKPERLIRLVDLRAGTAMQIGRQGGGPGEYRLPLRLYALRGDSSVAFDMANGTKGLIITPQGAAAGVLSTGDSPTTPVRVTESTGFDAKGLVYSEVRGAKGDSIGIERLDRTTGTKEFVAYVSPYVVSPLRPPPGRSSGSARSGGPAVAGGAPPPFYSRDQWAVAPDGRVAVVSVEPYRVTFSDTTGARRSGPPIGTERVPVTEALKKSWREARQRPVATLISNGSGGTEATYRPPRYVEPAEWPDHLPPFLDRAVRFAPDGMLWVQRATAAEAPPIFDVIDSAGRVSYRVTIPRRTRLVGFGPNAVYLVRIDADDLEYLQRHLPGEGAWRVPPP